MRAKCMHCSPKIAITINVNIGLSGEYSQIKCVYCNVNIENQDGTSNAKRKEGSDSRWSRVLTTYERKNKWYPQDLLSIANVWIFL